MQEQHAQRDTVDAQEIDANMPITGSVSTTPLLRMSRRISTRPNTGRILPRAHTIVATNTSPSGDMLNAGITSYHPCHEASITAPQSSGGRSPDEDRASGRGKSEGSTVVPPFQPPVSDPTQRTPSPYRNDFPSTSSHPPPPRDPTDVALNIGWPRCTRLSSYAAKYIMNYRRHLQTVWLEAIASWHDQYVRDLRGDGNQKQSLLRAGMVTSPNHDRAGEFAGTKHLSS